MFPDYAECNAKNLRDQGGLSDHHTGPMIAYSRYVSHSLKIELLCSNGFFIQKVEHIQALGSWKHTLS